MSKYKINYDKLELDEKDEEKEKNLFYNQLLHWMQSIKDCDPQKEGKAFSEIKIRSELRKCFKTGDIPREHAQEIIEDALGEGYLEEAD